MNSLRELLVEADARADGDKKSSGSGRGLRVKSAIAKIRNTEPGDLARQDSAS